MRSASTTPRFPLYIVSKGRADTRLTSRALERIGVPYSIVVEKSEYDKYAAVIDPAKILVLDPAYQRDYDTFDDLGDTKSKGPGPARNFAWDHSINSGASWHWVMDDNIKEFYRFNRNLKAPVSDGAIFRCMEDFALRYVNLPMVGPSYFMFVPRKVKVAPCVFNTRIYSCNLIRNDLPFRWRGRYNEDTDLSLRILKAGWCTAQFNAFQQRKITTQMMKGGNTEAFYKHEGTLPKTEMLMTMHPDVTRLVWQWRRWHHRVNYLPFKNNVLIQRDDIEIPLGVDDYGMKLYQLGKDGTQRLYEQAAAPEKGL